MKLERFSKNIEIMAENFGFKVKNEEWLKMLFSLVDKFEDDDIKYGFQEMCKITQEGWNKRYGYSGKPAIADWVNFFKLRKKHNRLELEGEKLRIAIDNARNGIVKPKEIEKKDYAMIKKMEKTIKNLSLKSNLGG